MSVTEVELPRKLPKVQFKDGTAPEVSPRKMACIALLELLADDDVRLAAAQTLLEHYR